MGGGRMVIAGLGACAGPQVGEGDGAIGPEDQPEVGWVATLEGFAHDVAGTAEIVDERSIELRDFTYGGGGVNAQLFLAVDGGTL